MGLLPGLNFQGKVLLGARTGYAILRVGFHRSEQPKNVWYLGVEGKEELKGRVAFVCQ